jgi:hypothetical protein
MDRRTLLKYANKEGFEWSKMRTQEATLVTELSEEDYYLILSRAAAQRER